jgi:hypothetical protein
VIDLDALERDIRHYRNVGAVMDWQQMLALIQRLREAEAERDRLSASEWIDGKTLADQAQRIRELEQVREAALYARDQLEILTGTDHYGNEVARAYIELNETLNDFARAAVEGK